MPHASHFVYCVACASEEVGLGAIGIDDNEVYSVVRKDICALVHDCPPRPYHSDDAGIVAAWILAHHRVVDAAWKRWGTVLPLRFNSIIDGGQGDADERLLSWLDREYLSLTTRLHTLAGKAEYGVQIFWDTKLMSEKVADTSPEVSKLREEIGSPRRGLAYMYRERLAQVLKTQMEARAAGEFKELYSRLSRCVQNIHVEKQKPAGEGRSMLMNLSCLVSLDGADRLKAELEEISQAEGYTVRLAGPLPPYSFA